MRAYLNELALAEACAAAKPEQVPLEALLAARFQHPVLAEALFCARGMLGTRVRPNLCLRDLGDKLQPDKRRLFYHNYPGGSGLMAGSVFGKIAGEGAAGYALA